MAIGTVNNAVAVGGNVYGQTNVPALPAVDMAWTPVLVLTGIAVGLFAVGLWGFRLRDLETK